MDDTAPVSTDAEREEADLRRAILKSRDFQMATVFTLWWSMACDEFPVEMRRSVSKLFDLRQVEDDHKRLAQEYGILRAAYEQARELLAGLHAEIDEQEARRDLLLYQLSSLEKRVKALENNVLTQKPAAGSGQPKVNDPTGNQGHRPDRQASPVAGKR